ncbi:hypothetical protein OUZ56_010077 [Daphnia magna]|uniref:Uncharacterized protein n=1 Tax=Daphnia magna TaxID=35525 RepID=A0ABR0AHY1_9CRUS|nr:hypothetical protein OUZ56_010077 [Daphnia magna]
MEIEEVEVELSGRVEYLIGRKETGRFATCYLTNFSQFVSSRQNFAFRQVAQKLMGHGCASRAANQKMFT